MRTTSALSIRRLGALLATVWLAACASTADSTDRSAHPPDAVATSPTQPGSTATTNAQPAGTMMGGQPGAGMMSGNQAGQMNPESMNMGQMCAMHRNMQKLPIEQRQAMMAEHMKGMSPEMRQQHMEMMQHCQ